MKIDFGTKLLSEKGTEETTSLGSILAPTFYRGNIGKGRLSFRLYQLSGTCTVQELTEEEADLLKTVAEVSTGQIYDAYERSIIDKSPKKER